MKPIFCGNFDYEARQSDVERLFRRYGKVDRVDMKSGFAFIYMEDERDADDAIRALDRSEFGRKGRRIRVEWTKQDRGVRRPMGSSRRSSANTRPSKTLFVINFDPHYTRPKDLERHFDSYGKISNVRIRKNFAFVQYEFQEDATKALEATNMSKLMDRVISVEYAVRDDDEHKSAYTPDRNRDRSPDRRGYDRRRSPSPYGRERGSPDYGHGPSRSPYRKEKASPDYGRGTCGRSPSPYRSERTSPNYGLGITRTPYIRERSRSPHRQEKASAENGRAVSPSPYRRERASTDIGRVTVSRSPYRSERASDENGRAVSRSPYRRERLSPDNGVELTRSPSERERCSTGNGRDRTPSPYQRDKESPDNGLIPSPDSKPEPRDSPAFDGGAESPSTLHSHSPPAEED